MKHIDVFHKQYMPHHEPVVPHHAPLAQGWSKAKEFEHHCYHLAKHVADNATAAHLDVQDALNAIGVAYQRGTKVLEE